MSNTIVKRFLFGENAQYFYEFHLHTVTMPGSSSPTVTIMMTSSNVSNNPEHLIASYIPELIEFLAKLIVEYNANYDGFHNQLDPLSYEESDNIADKVNEMAINMIAGK